MPSCCLVCSFLSIMAIFLLSIANITWRSFLWIIHIIAGLTAIEAWMLSCILFVFGCLIGNINFLALTIFCCHSIFTLETYNRILSLCIIIVFINNQSRIWRFSPTYWFIILRICNNSSSEAVGISPTSSQSRKGKDIIMAWLAGMFPL